MEDAGIDVKLVILGSTNVGKTSITMRYCHNSFSTPTSATIGASFLQKRLQLEKTKLTLQIWDTAGQERFRSMAPMYYRNAKAAILVFDLTQEATFVKLREWLNDLRRHVDNEIVLAVVGNKCDAPNITVTTERIKAFADEIGAQMYLTSAKTGQGVEQVFHQVSMKLLEKHQIKDGDDTFAAIRLEETNIKHEKKCC